MDETNEVVAYYDDIADTYDESRFGNSYGEFIDAEERMILDQVFPSDKREKRLEIACGTGRLTNYATYGLDASGEMLAHAEGVIKMWCSVKRPQRTPALRMNLSMQYTAFTFSCIWTRLSWQRYSKKCIAS